MNEIIERIKEAYILETDAEVAEFLDLNPSTLSMQKNRGRLNLKLIIEKCSELNKNWLLEGEGPIWKKDLEPETAAIPVYSSLCFREKNKIDLQHSVEDGDIFINMPEKWDYVSSQEHLIGYTIHEDTVAPPLREGDIAIFDLSNKEPSGEIICLVSADHKIICRRIEEANVKSYIVNDDKGQDNLEIPQGGNTYNIIGEMVWLLRKI